MKSPNKLKIGVNGRFLTKPFTGIGRYTINLFANLARQNEDFEVFMVTPEAPPDAVLRALGLSVRVIVRPENRLWKAINSGLAKSMWELGVLGRAWRELGVDLVHLPYPSLFGAGDVPVVMTVHDTFPWTMPEYRDRGRLSRLYNDRTLTAARKANRLLSVSQWSRDEILAMGGFDAGRIDVVHNACEFSGPRDDEAVLRRFGLEKGKYLFYMGGYDRRKNVQRLVNVFEQYVAPVCGHRLVLGGARVLGNNLFAEAMVAGADGRIVKTGFLDNADLQVLYSHAEAFISLTTAEGFNLPLLEAISTHCPPIVSDLKVHREVAGESAFYLDLDKRDSELGEKIVSLLKDRKAYNSLRDKAECFATSSKGKRFSWATSAKQTARIYYQLLS